MTIAKFVTILCCCLSFGQVAVAQDGISSDLDDLRYFYYPHPNRQMELYFNSGYKSFNDTPFLRGAPVVIIVDGFLSNVSTPMSQITKNGFLERNPKRNVIVFDWGHLSGSRASFSGNLINIATIYARALKNIGNVGRRLAEFIDFMRRTQEIQPQNVHIVGHSLGAHIGGAAGRFYKELFRSTLGRISGLDPAGPFFSYQLNPGRRLDKSDAKFVDIYHTSRGTLGDSAHRTGSINVYVNGGDKQPGCEQADKQGLPGQCSHSYSWKFYNKASNQHIKACPCSGFSCQCNKCNYNCSTSRAITLGEHTSSSARGAYHVREGPIP